MRKRIKRLVWFIKFWRDYEDFHFGDIYKFMEWHLKNMEESFADDEIVRNQHKRLKEIKVMREYIRRYNEWDYRHHDKDYNDINHFNIDRKALLKNQVKHEELEWEEMHKLLKNKVRSWWI